MRFLEIGGVRYVSKYAPDITDFFSTPPGDRKARLSLRDILQLRKKLRAGAYDLVIYHIIAKVTAPWDRSAFPLKGIVQALIWTLFSSQKISWHIFHWILCGTNVPLIIIDAQDAPRITKTESRWLDRSTLWFMRELPPNHMNLFLNMDRRCGDVINVRRRPELSRNFHKIRPLGLGLEDTDMPPDVTPPAVEKIHDIFYAGANHTSTVRSQGFQELKALSASGLKIQLPEERLSRPDFYRACAQSWLVWSPEGQGWDCYRHAEALLLGSVPVINSPTIKLCWPLIDGEHCFYYTPEPGGLTRVLERILADKDRLKEMSAKGRAYVLKHHRRSAFTRYIFAELGMLDQVAPHLRTDLINSTAS